MEKIRDFTICNLAHERLGYFGWPSIAKLEDGTLVAAASGPRQQHICPWGKTAIFRSADEGKTWSAPLCITNTPLDDRDAGLVPLGGQRLAVTWFTSNTLQYCRKFRGPDGVWPPERKTAGAVMDAWSAQTVERFLGSWIRVSEDGGDSWSDIRKVPVSSPHGFTVLKDGSWLYLGKIRHYSGSGRHKEIMSRGEICALRSTDEGLHWETMGTVPRPQGIHSDVVHEPHALELDDGTILGAIRVQNPFSIYLTRSTDGGRTWSVMENLNWAGSPPHLLKHSSGAILCTYGYRSEPFGQRARISRDDGKTWEPEIILRDDGPTLDLGYPASVELKDGSILTVYYQQDKPDEPCSLLGTVWKL